NIRGSAQHTYCIEVSRPGLKHQGTTTRSSRLKVEYHCSVFCPWMFAHKSRCAEHARLLTVREQYDYVVRKRASGAQGPNGLENGSDACAVVSGTRSGFDAVVMSDKKDRWSATLPAGHSRQNVLDSSGVGIACADTSSILDLRLEA